MCAHLCDLPDVLHLLHELHLCHPPDLLELPDRPDRPGHTQQKQWRGAGARFAPAPFLVSLTWAKVSVWLQTAYGSGIDRQGACSKEARTYGDTEASHSLRNATTLKSKRRLFCSMVLENFKDQQPAQAASKMCVYSKSPFARTQYFYTAGSRNELEGGGHQRATDTQRFERSWP